MAAEIHIDTGHNRVGWHATAWRDNPRDADTSTGHNSEADAAIAALRCYLIDEQRRIPVAAR
jgi:hypothetical protein